MPPVLRTHCLNIEGRWLSWISGRRGVVHVFGLCPRYNGCTKSIWRSDLIVLGVNTWEESNASAYMKSQGFTYGLLLKGEEIAKAYRVEILPTVYVIGSDGKILYRSIGVDDKLSSFLANQFQTK